MRICRAARKGGVKNSLAQHQEKASDLKFFSYTAIGSAYTLQIGDLVFSSSSLTGIAAASRRPQIAP